MPITGKDVAINGVPNGGYVEIEHSARANPIYHSSGEGGADRADGNIDFTGSYRAWGHTPSVFCNDSFELAYTLDGEAASSGESATVRCIGLDIVVPTFDPQTLNAVYYVVYFGADGEDLVAGGATTGAATALYSSKDLGCTIAGAEQTNVVSMKWMFRCNVQARPDSDSNGVYRRPESGIDWIFQCFRHIDSMANISAKNTVGSMAMQVTSTESWTASWGKVLESKGRFDPQTGEILGVDIQAGKCASSAGVIGTISSPSGQVWPPT